MHVFCLQHILYFVCNISHMERWNTNRNAQSVYGKALTIRHKEQKAEQMK